MKNKANTEPTTDPFELPFDDVFPHAVDGFSERLREDLTKLGALGTQSNAEVPSIE